MLHTFPFVVQEVLNPRHEPQLADPALEEFGRRCRDAQHLSGRSIADIAGSTCLSKQTVAWALRGVMASRRTVEALERELGVDASDLVAGRDRYRITDASGQEWVLARLANREGEML